MNWMDDRDSTEIDLTSVDIGLQGGVVGSNQTPLTSQFTDIGLQSYMDRAPVPRVWANTPTNTPAAGGNTVIIWNRTLALCHDPFNMLDAAGGVTLPLDGYYSLEWTGSGNTALAGGSNYMQWGWQIFSVGVFVGLHLHTQATGALTSYQGSSTWKGPLRAGDKVAAMVGNATAGAYTMTAVTSFMSVTWEAPYDILSPRGG